MAFTRVGFFRTKPYFPKQVSSYRQLRTIPTAAAAAAATRRYCTPNKSNALILRQSSLEKVEDILLHKFHDQSLLAQALTHRSVVNSSNHSPVFYEDSDNELKVISRNNERLELLGDHVFGLLATQVLYERDDNQSEGELTHALQSILSRRSADKYFRSLGLDKYILESEHLRGTQGYRYGDCFEALLAALFLDGGLGTASAFFRLQIVSDCDIFAGEGTIINYKQKLQEYLMSQGLPSPALATRLKYNRHSYDCTTQQFSQSIILFGQKVAVGRGSTRIAADQNAAKRLLTNLQKSQATCFLIRLARRANDDALLQKLQRVRDAQVAADSSKINCSS